MKKKAKLILGGGVAYGLAHIGAIKAIVEDYEVISIVGTSMGAIIGGCFACGFNPDEMLELAQENRTAQLFNPLNLDLSRCGIFDGKAILKIFDKWTQKADIRESPVSFIAVAYDLVQSRSVLIDKGKISDAMRASSSLPYVFAPHSMGKYMLVDGGVEHPLPLAFADLVPGEVCIAVNVLPPASKKAERINLKSPAKASKLSLHQVFIQSLMQNQAFIALQEMLEFKPDIYIDAHDSRFNMLDLARAKEFCDFGYSAARAAMSEQKDQSFIDQLRSINQKVLARIREPLDF